MVVNRDEDSVMRVAIAIALGDILFSCLPIAATHATAYSTDPSWKRVSVAVLGLCTPDS